MRTRARHYDELANSCRLRAAGIGDDAGTIARSLPATALSGGNVRALLDDTLGVTLRNHLRIVDELEGVAVLAEQRAAVCRQFEQAYRRYEVALADWRAMPTELRSARPPLVPTPPAPWVLA